MKVLLVHNFYKSSAPSGENTVFQNELELLNENGVEVVTYYRYNDNIENLRERIHAAASVIWSRKAYREMKQLIEREKPDIAHFHNIWYLISPSAYDACKDAGIPVVQTMHNFRLFCANAMFFRDDKTCILCQGKRPWRGVLYGCYASSKIRSLPIVASEICFKLSGSINRKVDAYIALGSGAKDKLIKCGLPPEKIFVKYNFSRKRSESSVESGDYLLFTGRLSKRKGIDILLEALSILKKEKAIDIPVKIAGDGQERGFVEKAIKENGLTSVELLGNISHDVTLDGVRRAKLVVIPSRWFEMFPMSIVEAFSYGKCVVGSNIDSIREIIRDGKTGFLFNSGDPRSLASKIERLFNDEALCREMGRNASLEYEEKFSPQANYKTLLDIYERTIKGHGNG